MLVQVLADAADPWVAVAAQQHALHAATQRSHLAPELCPRERPVSDPLPEPEHFPRRPEQVVAEPARDPALAFGQAGEIPLEVRPAILEPAERPIYPGPVAMNDPGERLPEQPLGDLGRPRQAAGEEGE